MATQAELELHVEREATRLEAKIDSLERRTEQMVRDLGHRFNAHKGEMPEPALVEDLFGRIDRLELISHSDHVKEPHRYFDETGHERPPTHEELMARTGVAGPRTAEPQYEEVPCGPDLDQWKHRSKGMQCAGCVFYVPKVNAGPSLRREIGRCRRRAPTMSGWPVMFPADWCGDHKLDEEKV
jgi:hypothetical protein